MEKGGSCWSSITPEQQQIHFHLRIHILLMDFAVCLFVCFSESFSDLKIRLSTIYVLVYFVHPMGSLLCV